MRAKLIGVLVEYLGRHVLASDVLVVEHPSLAGVFAVRWQKERDGHVDFIVSVPEDGRVDAMEHVEEVEFRSWPPKSAW